jgi:murein DD-endopeptidase MepM/ murein hydrolase activator NlpD
LKSKQPRFPLDTIRITLFRGAYGVFIGLIFFLNTSCSNHPAVISPPPPPSPIIPSSDTPKSTSTATPALPSIPTENRSSPGGDKLKIGPCSPLAVLSLDEVPAFITQPFIAPGLVHNAEHPDWVQRDDGHHGVDIGYYKINGKLFTGTPVLAALDGKIAALIHDRPPYGNMVIIETPFERIPPILTVSTIPVGNSLYTLYAHLQNLQAFTIGQSVACGQQLAETGLSGATGGPHLHFETRWGLPEQTFQSMAYYRADASAEEMSNYEKWRMSATFHLLDPMQLLKLHP